MKAKYQAPEVKVFNYDVRGEIMDYEGGDVTSAPGWMETALDDEMENVDSILKK